MGQCGNKRRERDDMESSTPRTTHQKLSGKVGSENNNTPTYLTMATIDILWRTRNKKVYDKNIEIENTANRLMKKIKKRITIDNINNRTDNLESIWSIKGVLCTYNDQRLKLNI